MYLLVKKQMKTDLISLCALNFDANQFSSSICMFLSVNSDFSILGILGRIVDLKGIVRHAKWKPVAGIKYGSGRSFRSWTVGVQPSSGAWKRHLF